MFHPTQFCRCLLSNLRMWFSKGILPDLPRMRSPEGKVITFWGGYFPHQNHSHFLEVGIQQRNQTFLVDLRFNCPSPSKRRINEHIYLLNVSYAQSIFIYSISWTLPTSWRLVHYIHQIESHIAKKWTWVPHPPPPFIVDSWPSLSRRKRDRDRGKKKKDIADSQYICMTDCRNDEHVSLGCPP